MTSSLRIAFLGFGLLALGSTAALPQAPGQDTGDGLVVMSDTPEWCAHLVAEVVQLRRSVAQPDEDVDRLLRDGKRLCAIGHVRVGITRLRHALMHLQALQTGQEVPSAP